MAKIITAPLSIALNLTPPTLTADTYAYLVNWLNIPDLSLSGDFQITNGIDPTANYGTITQFQKRGATLSNLKLFVKLPSFPEVSSITLTPDQDDEIRNTLQFQNDILFPYASVELALERQGFHIPIANTWIQNKPPGYWISLDRLVSSTALLELDTATNLVIKVKTEESGFVPQTTDTLTVYGQLSLQYWDTENQVGVMA